MSTMRPVSMATARRLASLFNRIETVEIVVFISSPRDFDEITTLLEPWVRTLKTVRVWIFWHNSDLDSIKSAYEQFGGETNFEAFIRLFNSMPELECLTFYANISLLGFNPVQRNLPVINAQFLARLVEFDFTTVDPLHILIPSLQQVGKGCHCRHIKKAVRFLLFMLFGHNFQ